MKQLKKDVAAVLKALNTLAQKMKKMQAKLDKPEMAKKAEAPKAKASKAEAPKAKASKAKAPKAKAPKAKAPKAKTKPVKKSPIKKPAKKKSGETAYDTLLANIDAKGVSVKDLISKTGFDSKKIANMLYRAKKQGKIKNETKGVYVKA